jgi:hypothetical protein
MENQEQPTHHVYQITGSDLFMVCLRALSVTDYSFERTLLQRVLLLIIALSEGWVTNNKLERCGINSRGLISDTLPVLDWRD